VGAYPIELTAALLCLPAVGAVATNCLLETDFGIADTVRAFGVAIRRLSRRKSAGKQASAQSHRQDGLPKAVMKHCSPPPDNVILLSLNPSRTSAVELRAQLQRLLPRALIQEQAVAARDG
jgi:hypothetical protein